MSEIPSSVRFKDETKSRLGSFLKQTPQIGAKDIIDFAVYELMNALDSGSKIIAGSTGSGYGLMLVKPDGSAPENQTAMSANLKTIDARLAAIESAIKVQKLRYGTTPPVEVPAHPPAQRQPSKKIQ